MKTMKVRRSSTPVTDRSDPEVVFVFEGRSLTAREGDSVAAALIANGVHVFGRSWKYHRPRGYRCGRGHCSACSMRVDGLPGVRTCVTTVRPGMTVEREHGLPTADYDVLQAIGLFSPLMPPGFYYRWFRRSPRLWGIFERGLAQISGQGDMPSSEAITRLGAARCERRHGPDVLVVGGGVAGMSAALAAADAGADVLLVEQDDRLGGRLLDAASQARASSVVGSSDGDRPTGAHLPAALAARVLVHDRVEVLTGASAVGWYEEGMVAVDCQPDLLLLEPTAVVLATGGYDRGLPFTGWDMPGVMLAAGARRLLNRYGLKPGSRAVVVTTDDLGYEIAWQLASAGVEIACVADTRPSHAIRREAVGEAAAANVSLLSGASGVKVHGLNRVSALTLRVDGNGGSRTLTHRCDLVCISAGTRPADDLLLQASSRGSVVLSVAEPSEGLSVPWLAGLVAGASTPESASEQGRAAGSAAARHVTKGGQIMS